MFPLTPYAIGVDETAYGDNNLVIINDPLQQQRISTLRIGQMRRYISTIVNGNIVCAALGCNQEFTGDQWVQAIRSSGTDVIMEVPIDVSIAPAICETFQQKHTTNMFNGGFIGNEPEGMNPPMNSTTYL